MRDFRKIDAWRLADDFAVAVYEGTQSFPRCEAYGLTSQLRRAATSVPANIVEGSARLGHREFLHFLGIARGSLAESQYFIHLATRLKYLDEATSVRLAQQGRQLFACLHGLIGAVESEARRIPFRGQQQGKQVEESQAQYDSEVPAVRSSLSPFVLQSSSGRPLVPLS